MLMDFSGKVVIVTGSTSGIGEQTVLDFAANGAKVVVHGRDKSRLNSVVQKCKELSPTKQTPLGVIADIADDGELKKLIDLSVSTFGRIDVLVNNAASSFMSALEDPNLLQVFDETIKINLRPTVVLSNLAIPYLIASKGCIINISSCFAVKPMLSFMTECTAAAGIDMFTRSMALELGPKGVRVNCIRPGFIKTPAYERLGCTFEDMEDLKKQPLQKHGRPRDVSNCVLFLASAMSEFITGSAVSVDGGINDA